MKGFSLSGLKEVTNRGQILAKVRDAMIEKNDTCANINLQDDTWVPFKEEDGAEFTFIERFKETGGIFMYFETLENFKDCIKQLVVENEWIPLCTTSEKIRNMLADAEIELSDDYKSVANPVSLTDCECLVAQTGSIMFSDACSGSRAAYSAADTLLVYATPRQFVAKIKDAFRLVREKYSKMPAEVTLITGVSSNYDIDNTLVLGALGIRQIALFLVEE